ncbi:hypothetical protein VNO77_02638 [Canavalia gladiata]|uniref:Uncharacterized protein n=1 Tax=Canavalia gladiata TaxID=3824 RepID=A0AAN9MTD7_CANGL
MRKGIKLFWASLLPHDGPLWLGDWHTSSEEIASLSYSGTTTYTCSSNNQRASTLTPGSRINTKPVVSLLKRLLSVHVFVGTVPSRHYQPNACNSTALVICRTETEILDYYIGSDCGLRLPLIS